MTTVGRRRVLHLAVLATVGVSGCLGVTAAPTDDGDGDGGGAPGVRPTPVTVSPDVTTVDVVRPSIEPAPLVVYDAPGFSFEYPRNWQERPSEPGEATFEYATDDGRVLGDLRAWSNVNTVYDAVDDAEQETVRRLSEAGHEVLGTRSVSLPDDRPGRVVDYRLDGTPVRGTTVVSLAGPWILRIVLLVHADAYTTRFAATADGILTSLRFMGPSAE
jgi:hypothetical protein